jgi:hypothetical protein
LSCKKTERADANPVAAALLRGSASGRWMATAQHARLAGHAMRLGRGVGPWPERSAVGVLRKPLRALRHVLICKRLWALMHMCGSSHYGRCSPLRSTGVACGLGALNLLSQWKNRKPRLGVAARDGIDGASRVAACTGGDRATHVLAECAGIRSKRLLLAVARTRSCASGRGSDGLKLFGGLETGACGA